jgi:hypothetical protein
MNIDDFFIFIAVLEFTSGGFLKAAKAAILFTLRESRGYRISFVVEGSR